MFDLGGKVAIVAGGGCMAHPLDLRENSSSEMPRRLPARWFSWLPRKRATSPRADPGGRWWLDGLVGQHNNGCQKPAGRVFYPTAGVWPLAHVEAKHLEEARRCSAE